MKVLLDTDICSHYVRGNPLVGRKALQYAGSLYVSVLTAGELLVLTERYASAQRWKNAIQEFLGFVEILDVTFEVARQFAQLRAAMLDTGVPKPPIDLFIAATAITHDITLITHNSKDFSPIPGLQESDSISEASS